MNTKVISRQSELMQQAIIIACCFTALIVGNGTVISFAFGSFLVPVSTELGLSRSTATIALMTAMMAVSISAPIVGRLIDRFGVRKIVLPSVVIFSLATMSVGVFANGPISFIALYFFLGLFSSGQAPTAYSKVVAGWFKEKRGLALGVVMASIGVGAALVPSFVHTLIASFGWRGAYIGLGIAVFAIAFPAVVLGVNEKNEYSGSKVILAGASSKDIWTSAEFWRMGVIFSLIGLVATGCIAHLIPMMTDRGISSADAVKIASMAGAAVILGRVCVGFLLDRFNDRSVTIAILILMIAGAILLAVAPTSGVIIGAVIMGVGLGAEVDMLGYMLARRYGMRSFGEAHGALFAMFTASSGIGAFLMGVSFDKTGVYTLGLYMFVGVLIIALVTSLWLKVEVKSES